MTAPHTLSAPAIEPSASANELADSDAFWDRALAPETPEAPAPTPAPVTPAPEGEEEAAPAEVVAEEVAPETEEAAPAEEAEEAAPEAEEPPPPPKPKATVFKVYEGTEEVELPDVEIEFKANGELRRMPYDKVIRLAQSGFYNEKLTEEVKQARLVVSEKEQAIAEREAALQEVMARYQAVMEKGDDFFIEQRDEYNRRNSPESRAARAEAQLRAERAQRQQLEVATQAQAFLERELQPRVAALLTQYSSVSDTEAAGWLAPQLKALEVHGMIPPQRYGAVQRLLEDDLAQWMGHVHDQRSTTAQASETKRQAVLRKAQVEATKAKRQLTKVASPAAKAGAATGTPVPSKKERQAMSAQQVANRLFRDLGFGDDEE